MLVVSVEAKNEKQIKYAACFSAAKQLVKGVGLKVMLEMLLFSQINVRISSVLSRREISTENRPWNFCGCSLEPKIVVLLTMASVAKIYSEIEKRTSRIWSTCSFGP